METVSLFLHLFVFLLLLGHGELTLANSSIGDGIICFELRKGLSLVLLKGNQLCTRVLLRILCALQTKEDRNWMSVLNLEDCGLT